MIAIIDYGMGNLRSVQKGFEKTGHAARVVRDPASLKEAAGIVLPGVGAFGDCMRNLTDSGLLDPLVRQIREGKPYLGICLGLQILFTESEEFGRDRGLDLIPGRVRRFDFRHLPEDSRRALKIPHMGWNRIRKIGSPSLLEDVPDGAYLYFVHSYYVVPEDRGVIAATTEYGTEFTSMIRKGNIFAMQFHPEKSQDLGLSILDRFARLAEG